MLKIEDKNELQPIGTLEVPTINFARGSSKLLDRSKVQLDLVIEQLNNFPLYYLIVRGNAKTEADASLAINRAEAVSNYLIDNNIDRDRIKFESSQNYGRTTVSFVLGERTH